jgi:hypothetical protein
LPADAKGWRVPIENSETYQITMFLSHRPIILGHHCDANFARNWRFLTSSVAHVNESFAWTGETADFYRRRRRRIGSAKRQSNTIDSRYDPNLINLFFSSPLAALQNKLGCLSLARFLASANMCV